MTVLQVPDAPVTTLGRLRWTLADGWTVVRRNLTQLRYSPGQLVGALVFPAIMVVLFGYVFGSAIPVPGGGNYREYLMPGLFVMASVTAVMSTMTVVATDIGRGVMDRFRSMPMARSAVPFGQSGVDVIVGAADLVVMAAIGLVVGWRIHEGVARAVAAFALLLLFRYAITWVGVFLGMLVRNEETADQYVPLIFPVTMVSNAFVPTSGMPAWLRAIADWNPVSAVVAACRKLFGNVAVSTEHLAWPLAHPVTATLAWSLLLLAIFVPLTIHRFRTANR